MDALRTRIDVSLGNAVAVMPESISRTPLTLRAGRIADTQASHAYRVELRDHLVFPGLINAHDHLQVNCIPPLRSDKPFPNSYAWIAAFQRHFDNPAVVAALQLPKALRMRHGALKNLLAGTTFVAHHDPWHTSLDAADFPVALLREFGWCYAVAGPGYGPPLEESFAATPVAWPWMIHLAEGTDPVAQAELDQLDRRGCLAANSVLIHGVGLSERDIDRVIVNDAAVVWCPTSNLALLGRTLDPRRLHAAGRLALGSDSRLSGARDLLDELTGIQDYGLTPRQLLGLATTDAARILRLHGRGGLSLGAPADLIVVEDRGGDEASSLVGIERSRIRAVVRDGVPQIADPDFAEWFAVAGVPAVSATLDGRPKLLARYLAEPALIALEPGLEVPLQRHAGATGRAAHAANG